MPEQTGGRLDFSDFKIICLIIFEIVTEFSYKTDLKLYHWLDVQRDLLN